MKYFGNISKIFHAVRARRVSFKCEWEDGKFLSLYMYNMFLFSKFFFHFLYNSVTSIFCIRFPRLRRVRSASDEEISGMQLSKLRTWGGSLQIRYSSSKMYGHGKEQFAYRIASYREQFQGPEQLRRSVERRR